VGQVLGRIFMGDEANRLEELAQAEYEKFIQAHAGDGDPPRPPPPSDAAKRRQRVALLIFLILFDVVLLLEWLLTGPGGTW
jgi:hypothetical protein